MKNNKGRDTMGTITKKELILEGLDCANCSSKIENKAKQIDGIDASMNFMTKTLTLDIDDDVQFEGILEQIKSIVNKYEPDVIVKEKDSNKVVKKTFILEGLG